MFKLEKLQEMASAKTILLQKILPSLKAGQAGKQKGMLQVSWE
jgi:hypothetical protein